MNDENKTYCRLAWCHTQILPNNEFRPCCRFLAEEIPQSYRSQDNTMSDVLQNQFIVDIRRQMLRGDKVAGCKKCYEEEEAQKNQSIRQLYNRNLYGLRDFRDAHESLLEFIELATDNTCNLKCLICSPVFSSKWNADAKELGWAIPSFRNSSKNLIEKLSKNFHSLKLIKLTGGEPLLIQEYSGLLDAIVAENYSRNITLNYSMNGTVFPNSETIELWKEFKCVEVSISLDGVEDSIEYSRFPLNWNSVAKNLEALLELSMSEEINLRIGIRPSVSIYNIFDLKTLLDFWLEKLIKIRGKAERQVNWFNPTHVQRPEHLSVTCLPSELKKEITKHYDDLPYDAFYSQAIRHIVSYMNSEDKFAQYWPQFISYTTKLDSLRKNSFLRVHPQFERYWHS